MPQKPQLMLGFFYSMGSTQRFPRSLGALDASKTSTYVKVFLFNGINTAVPPKPRGARCLKNLNLCWGFFIQWDQHSGSPEASGRSMPQKPQLMLGFFYSMGSTQRFPRSFGALDASKTSTYVGVFLFNGINTAVPPKPRGARCLKNLNLCWVFLFSGINTAVPPKFRGARCHCKHLSDFEFVRFFYWACCASVLSDGLRSIFSSQRGRP